MELSPRALKLDKNEVSPDGAIVFRDKFEFLRPGT